jgi:alginate O-acetyltransferase complex protein AlgI
MSLSTWFRDYIYIPVGGNKGGTGRLIFGVLLVFFTSGLWHGANATMIYFGLSQGVLYLFDRFVFRKTFSGNSFGVAFRRLKTAFLFMMTLVFFRSGNVGQSFDIFNHLWVSRTYCESPALNLQVDPQVWLFLLVGLVMDHGVVKERVDRWMSPLKLGYRWFWYLFFLTAVLLFGGAVNHPFVYFQF